MFVSCRFVSLYHHLDNSSSEYLYRELDHVCHKYCNQQNLENHVLT